MEFCELFLTHTKGETAGKPFILEPWQRRIMRALFGWKQADGYRWYRRLDLWIPRKNGKSALAAAIALYMTFADGEIGAEVYLVANDKEQAKVIFKVAAQMVKVCPELAETSTTFNRTSAIVVPETLASLMALSAAPGNKDGLNPSCVVFDEIHELRKVDLWEKMTTGSGTRNQPLLVCLSTAGSNRQTIGYREYKQDKRIAQGRSKIADRLVVIYEADPRDDWKSVKTWKKCNPALGSFLKIGTIKSLLAEALEDAAKEATLKRYHLNIWTSQKTGWIDIERWDACAGNVDPAKMALLPCWIGLDLSKRSDLTAACALFREEIRPAQVVDGGDVLPAVRKYFAMWHFWVPEEDVELKEQRDGVQYREWARAGLLTLTPGHCIEYAAVREFLLEEWARRFQIREVCYDPYNANMLVDDLQKRNLTTVEIPQVPKHVSPATMELKNLILSESIQHGDNPIARWMIENVAVLIDHNANERLTKKNSTSRIDGLAALVNALARASVADTKASVYEERGLQTL